jgi:hypothetical protein
MPGNVVRKLLQRKMANEWATLHLAVLILEHGKKKPGARAGLWRESGASAGGVWG